jgi:hypothetical protein
LPAAGLAGIARHALPNLFQRMQGTPIMNRLIWLVGAVVIVLFVFGYLGLR